MPLMEWILMIGKPNELILALCDEITVIEGHRDGSGETRVHLNAGFPGPTPIPADDEEIDPREKWRIRTSSKRLLGFNADADVLSVWHAARHYKKGRSLVVADQANDGRVAAILSWHYAEKPRKGKRPPHLVTSLALSGDPAMHAEDMVGAYLLCLTALAIASKTNPKHRVGLVLDNAIAMSDADLTEIGWKKGPKSDGYKGDYRVFAV
jgi:hypothetical protein